MQQIATALVKAQKAFAPALKTATNPHFKNKYADLATCVEAVIDALNENGIALIQRTHTADDGVTVETLFVHESGETISGGLLHFPANKQDPQGYMGCLTYARRGSLMSACGIAPEDDDGNAASRPAPKPVAKSEVRQGKPTEELAIKIAECKEMSTLLVLYAGLTKDEQERTKDMFTVRKHELSNKTS